MGMYSNYSIRLVNEEEDIEEIRQYLEEISEYNFYTDGNFLRSMDSYKWYEFDSDMISVSEKYPKVLFGLFRDYEEGDYYSDDGLISTHSFHKFKNGEHESFDIKLVLEPTD